MATSTPPTDSRREIFGWAMYDWANSAFSTTVGTVRELRKFPETMKFLGAYFL